MMRAIYATVEDVMGAIDVKDSARAVPQILRALESGCDTIDGDLHRRFAPTLATRLFDWPNHAYARTWRLWLDSNEVISVNTLTAGGTVIDPADYMLRRSDDLDEPPYDRIELDLGGSASFGGGDTHQQSISVFGLFAGAKIDETVVGELTANMGVTGSAGITMSPTVGVGSVLRIDDERPIVVAKTMVDSAQNLGGDMDAAKNDETVAVTDGTAYETGETLLIDAERMLIVDIAANDLTVERAWDGTTLAAHTTGADVFALAGFDVDRAQMGTTAATHASGAVIYRWDPPPAIRSLAIAEAINQLQQDQSAWGRTVGSGDNEREASGKGLADLRKEVMTAFGRQARLGAI